jgi:hypothetical protein
MDRLDVLGRLHNLGPEVPPSPTPKPKKNFAVNFSGSQLQDSVVISHHTLTQDPVTGGSWTVSVNGKIVSTIKCTLPSSLLGGPPTPVPSGTPQPITPNLKVNMGKGGGGGCGGGGGPAAQPSAPAILNLISLSSDAIIATDFKTQSDPQGPASVNGQPVVNFKTLITTQFQNGKAQYEVLNTSFAKNIPLKEVPCIQQNPGTDPAAIAVYGAVIAVASAKPSNVTPKIIVEGVQFPQEFLMSGQLQTFAINSIPPDAGGTALPTTVSTIEVSNLVFH